ncbi:hypothetical protein ACJJIU_14305 [Microbulbifer sp. CnH-101-E]|uniref:hypothetical protein n=1 Tax=unclassified Microbulbifer TaxID=2619833 RepID=UPI00403A57F0
MVSNVDLEELNEQRVKTKVYSGYLLAWNQLNKHIESSGTKLNLEEYLILFDEDKENYIVKFTRPFKSPVLGGSW